MKKNVLAFLIFSVVCSYVSAQTLYSNTAETGFKTNPNLSQLGNPRVAFDDVDILSGSVAGSDSIRITKVKVGIGRLANAPAVNVSVYYTPVEDTATLRNNLIRIPPVLIGTVSLPAIGATPVTTIVSLGDSVSTLFRVKTAVGNLYPGFSSFFIGVGLSVPGTGSGISLTLPIAPNDNNAFWIYNADSTVKRFVTNFGPNPPNPASTFYIQVFGYPVGGTLPVTLAGFKGERKGSVNNLSWTTLTEHNNSGFELQRSADGTNFGRLSFIASKAAAGGSNAGQLNYSFDDVNPLIGNAYYRLRQMDKDGKSILSNIVLIKAPAVVSLQLGSIYPNPATDMLNVVVVAPGNNRIKLMVTDIAGKVVIQQSAAINGGSNNLSLNIAKLSAGSYRIKAICANGCETAIGNFVKE